MKIGCFLYLKMRVSIEKDLDKILRNLIPQTSNYNTKASMMSISFSVGRKNIDGPNKNSETSYKELLNKHRGQKQTRLNCQADERTDCREGSQAGQAGWAGWLTGWKANQNFPFL